MRVRNQNLKRNVNELLTELELDMLRVPLNTTNHNRVLCLITIYATNEPLKLTVGKISSAQYCGKILNGLARGSAHVFW